MFGLHTPELIIVLVVALLVFGPKKLPEMGSSIGKSIKEFRKGMNELSNGKDKDDEPNLHRRTAEEARRELETLENEIANKKAAATAQETVQTEVPLNNVETPAHVNTVETPTYTNNIETPTHINTVETPAHVEK